MIMLLLIVMTILLMLLLLLPMIKTGRRSVRRPRGHARGEVGRSRAVRPTHAVYSHQGAIGTYMLRSFFFFATGTVYVDDQEEEEEEGRGGEGGVGGQVCSTTLSTREPVGKYLVPTGYQVLFVFVFAFEELTCVLEPVIWRVGFGLRLYLVEKLGERKNRAALFSTGVVVLSRSIPLVADKTHTYRRR